METVVMIVNGLIEILYVAGWIGVGLAVSVVVLFALLVVYVGGWVSVGMSRRDRRW